MASKWQAIIYIFDNIAHTIQSLSMLSIVRNIYLARCLLNLLPHPTTTIMTTTTTVPMDLFHVGYSSYGPEVKNESFSH